MKDIVKEELNKIIDSDFILEKPKDKNMGHYATPVAFSLAKKLKKSPVIIADEFIKKFDNSEVFSLTSVNGYLNIHLKHSFLNQVAKSAISNCDNFAKSRDKNSSLMIEYVSANPTGPLHIGHVRGAVYGDTLARIARHLGYRVVTEYYVNDAGNQIQLLGLSIQYAARELFNKERLEYPQNCYRGEYIYELARVAFDKFGNDIFKDCVKLSFWAKDEMIKLIKQNLSDANIYIDNWVNESSFYSELDNTISRLRDCNGVYESDGKIWLKSSQLNDEKDRVIIRDDGRPTYLAGDIVYHFDKFKRGFDNYINIWGADHHGYIARIKASIHFLGFDESKLEVILAQMVSLLKDGEAYKMSKRAGNFILMSDVLNEIGSDALRFIFISKKCDTALEFDVDKIKVQDSSNPIFYINYAHARINSLFQKVGLQFEDVMDEDIKNINQDGLNLLFEALILNDVLQDAYNTKSLQKLPDYLKSLSASFHKFYNENRVLQTSYQNAILKIFAVVAISIRTGLALMGIKAKDRMEH